ncbi:MmgE/PrpD family protein [Terrabacter sp. Ter38]|uniref:MmgE/PrpD family protein n=1 Tax=Terrabacter sp. Ter38 TaxID=2926030 RepID=UPI0021196248|nr:MmgE/PrpD family protein [Terrabacter sp. Ter38]
MTTLTAHLAAFAVATRENLPDRIAKDALARVTDTLGIAYAARETEPVRVALNLARSWGGHAQAALIGAGDRVPAPTAALVNGTAAHALDFDDTHVPSILHPSASVFPAALAAAEEVDAPGRVLLAGVAAGNEIAIRLGMTAHDETLNNSVFFERGLHATSICGAIGSAAAAAVVYGLTAEGVADAMGIAASMGAGLLEANRVGGTVKRMHCGWAAHGGVTAAQMAARGITAPASVLEGRFGFFNAYTGIHPVTGAPLHALLGDLGDVWELDRCFVKPYPTNVFTHTGIDAALTLAARGIRPEDVERVELSVPVSVTRTIAEPREAKVFPRSPYHAQFSGPFTFAMALHGGSGLGLYLDDFTDESLADPSIRRLASTVHYAPDPECEAIYPRHFPTIARVRLVDGTTVTEKVLTNLGTTERPLTPEQLALKFALTTRDLGPERSAALAAALDELPTSATSRVLLGSIEQ